MSAGQSGEIIKAKRLASLYNMVPNLLWSVISLLPVAVFCYTQLTLPVLFLFIGISMLPAFLSNSMINNMQLAKRTGIYKKLGVGFVLQLSQNGAIVNSAIRRRYPTYKALRRDQKSIRGLILQTYVFEKFHLTLFMFFCLTCFYALGKGLVMWAIGIFFLNLFYNVYPILLQQFIRLKLALHLDKNKTNMPAATPGFSKYRLKCLG